MIESVFVASPLFNPSERRLNKEITEVIEAEGIKVFLPQRDGMLLRDIVDGLKQRRCSMEDSKKIANRLIFHIDACNACDCDGTVLNLNGRVADEGALIEGAIAYCSRKPVVLYKNDYRSLIDGQDNPLVEGLSDLIVSDIEKIVPELRRQDKREKSLFDEMLEKGLLIKGGCGDIDKLVGLGLEYFS
jgi:nucleoside 2-deoxyribosyltransferase